MTDPNEHPRVDAPPGHAALRPDTLAGSVVVMLALTGVQRLVGFARAVLFCRWLDPEQLGQWDMALSFLLLAAPVAVLAMPGAFGRYVERYRQQGQLRAFLRRTGAACAVLTAGALAAVWLGRGLVAQAVFGSADYGGLVLVLGAALGTVIAFNFLTELFTALRSARLVSALFFLNSLAFAVLGVGLLAGWRNDAASVVAAYGAANLLSAAVAAAFLVRALGALPPDGTPPGHRALWARLMPFALWIWTVNLLTNLFEVADRYMIVHHLGGGPDAALSMVGQYHSSRVVPILLLSVAQMLGSMITPHLSADWEAGRREEVSVRLRLFLKLLAFGLTAAGVATLAAAPLLFGVAFRGKFAAGQAVLPWTLTYCTWFGLAMVTQTYLWCAEKARLATAALAVGLAANVGLNLVLIPRFGLQGAVLATAASNLLVLAMVVEWARRLGFRADRGLWVALGLPLAVCLGPWLGALVLGAVALEALTSDRLLNAEEKRRLAGACLPALRRLPWIGARWARSPQPESAA